MAIRQTLPGSGGTGDVSGGVFHASDVDKLPGGRTAYLASTTQVNITSLATVFTSPTFTANASRIFDIDADLSVRSSSAGDTITVTIYNSAGTQLRSQNFVLGDLNTDYCIRPVYTDINPSSGSEFYTIKAATLHGTGTFNSGSISSYMRVTDVSPSF